MRLNKDNSVKPSRPNVLHFDINDSLPGRFYPHLKAAMIDWIMLTLFDNVKLLIKKALKK